jgi:hypothetical protein
LPAPAPCCSSAEEANEASFTAARPTSAPCTTLENPLPMDNLHATIYHALGIAPTQFFVTEKRPVYVTKDGHGKVITDLYA